MIMALYLLLPARPLAPSVSVPDIHITVLHCGVRRYSGQPKIGSDRRLAGRGSRGEPLVRREHL